MRVICFNHGISCSPTFSCLAHYDLILFYLNSVVYGNLRIIKCLCMPTWTFSTVLNVLIRCEGQNFMGSLIICDQNKIIIYRFD